MEEKKQEKKPTKTTKPQKEEKSHVFAVIFTGGKQYEVRVGDVLNIEKITGEYKSNDKIVFDKVLLVDDGKDTTIGTPFIENAKVEAILEEEGKGKKIEVVKYKAKSRYLKRRGHRQPYFRVRISAIK